MVEIDCIATQIENVDQLPVIYGLLQKMNIQATIDSAIQPHGNWQGLSVGWVVTIWLMPLCVNIEWDTPSSEITVEF